MGEYLQRLKPGVKRCLTDEFMTGEKEALTAGEYEPFLDNADRALPLADFHSALDRVMEETNTFDPIIDSAAAPAIRTTLDLTRRQASEPGIWRYLAIVERPDFVRHRWAEFSRRGRHYWTVNLRPESNTFARLWWLAELTRNGEDFSATERLHELPKLLFQNKLSHFPPLLQACVEIFLAPSSTLKQSDQERVIKELSGRLTVIAAEALTLERARMLVQSLI